MLDVHSHFLTVSCLWANGFPVRTWTDKIWTIKTIAHYP